VKWHKCEKGEKEKKLSKCRRMIARFYQNIIIAYQYNYLLNLLMNKMIEN